MKLGRRARLAHGVLGVMYELRCSGEQECTSFRISVGVERKYGRLLGYGSLFWVLSALEKRGVLTSRWEAVVGERPRRKYYSLVVR